MSLWPSGASYSILSVRQPLTEDTVPIALLLLDILSDRLFIKFWPNLEQIAAFDELSSEYLLAIEEDLQCRLEQEGAEAVLRYFEDTLSGYLLISDRTWIVPPEDWTAELHRLFSVHISASRLNAT